MSGRTFDFLNKTENLSINSNAAFYNSDTAFVQIGVLDIENDAKS